MIVGLGNMGKEYVETRHNIGFWVLDLIAKRLEEEFLNKENLYGEIIKADDVILLKPNTMMNLSGKSVSAVANFYKVSIDEIMVVHDDLDIVVGEFKVQKGKGPKVHNGILSIEEAMGSKEFWRTRVGVDGREGDRTIKGEDYVLMKVGEVEKRKLNLVCEDVVDYLEDWWNL